MSDTETPPLKPQAADSPFDPAALQGNPASGIGLCLSGGGYRAMLYHVGALVRINELGLLPKLTEISAVSGGSIAAAQLALAWPKLEFDERGVASNLADEFAKPLMRFAKIGIDVRSVLKGDLVPGKTPTDVLTQEYDKHLFHGANLADLPSTPRFTFFATSLQTGRAWAFDADQALNARVGVIERPKGGKFFNLAEVVAASSAFPPLFGAKHIDLGRYTVKPLHWGDLYRPPFTTEAVLVDGGVYDNLASERVMRHCHTMLISNGGAITPAVGSPDTGLLGEDLRVTGIFEQRAEDERLARLMLLDKAGERTLAYWSIQKPVALYGVSDPLPLTPEQTRIAGSTRTRLNPFSDAEISLLLQAGYAGADGGLRARGVADDSRPGNFGNLPHAGRASLAAAMSLPRTGPVNLPPF